MTAESPAVVRSFPVGARYTCTVTLRHPVRGAVVSACVEWEPTTPKRLRPRELAAYRRGRDAAIAELATAMGVTAAVVEL